MGDGRAHIKIEFSVHGKDYKTDMSINWSPEDGGTSIDRRVREWFETCYGDAYGDWQAAIYESEREQRERAEEERERTEYERLKAKFG